jgi:hypothetical protein
LLAAVISQLFDERTSSTAGIVATILALCGASLGLAMAALASSTLDQTKLIGTVTAVAAGLSFPAAAIWGHSSAIWPTWNAWLIPPAVVGQGLGGILLGAISLVLLSGYARLSAPEARPGPMRRMSALAVVAAGGRTVYAATWFGILWMRADGMYEGGMAAVWAELKLMLIVRLFVGLVMAGVFSAAAWWAVRRRAIGGATWLAFLATEFAVLGELANQYIVRATGWPM